MVHSGVVVRYNINTAINGGGADNDYNVYLKLKYHSGLIKHLINNVSDRLSVSESFSKTPKAFLEFYDFNN